MTTTRTPRQQFRSTLLRRELSRARHIKVAKLLWVVMLLDFISTCVALETGHFEEANLIAAPLFATSFLLTWLFAVVLTLGQTWFLTTRFWEGTLGERVFPVMVTLLLVVHAGIVVNNYSLLYDLWLGTL